MGAELERPPVSRSPAAAGTPARRAFARAGVVVAVLGATLPATVPAAAPAGDAPATGIPLLSKPPAGAKRVAPTHAWADGPVTRGLTLDPRMQADFSPGPDGRRAVLRESPGQLKDVSPALQSPVLRDESGRARALPGGVVVTFAGAPDDAAARALLARHGETAVRRLPSGAWLVETPAGLVSLEVANRLAASGAFASAQPNWWVERALK